MCHFTLRRQTSNMYLCDHCRKEYQYKKSLVRHIRERHVNNKHYPCAIKACRSKFIRRGYLITHLRKIHNIEHNKANEMADNVKCTYITLMENKSILEDISDSEECFKNMTPQRSPYNPSLEDISDEENELFNLIESTPPFNDENDENNNVTESFIEELTDNDNTGVIGIISAKISSGSSEDNYRDDTENVTEPLLEGVINPGRDDFLGIISDGSISSSSIDNHSDETEIVTEPLLEGVIDTRSDDIIGNISDDVSLNESNIDTHSEEEINHDNNSEIDEEPEIILIDSGDDDGEETLITTINLTLTKKEQFRNGQLQSVTRSSSIGYSQNLCENDITANLQDIFTYVQNEFTEYANYYHDNNN